MSRQYMRVRRVALLGANGLVAQRFQQRLANHPWFELVAVYGSPRTVGMELAELQWHLPESRPDLPELVVRSLDSVLSDVGDFDIVFSALPSEVAQDVEKPLATLGCHVFSNASSHRMDDDVPLVIADLNPHHLLSLRNRTEPGFVACGTNCTIVPAALPLKPLWDFIGLDHVSISTEQSLSGGGFELLSAYRETGEYSIEIPGEAEKMHEECLSLLGRAQTNGVRPANLPIDISVKRVDREYGHIVKVVATLHFEKEQTEVIEWMQNYRSRAQALELPSAPHSPFIFVDDLIPESIPDPSNNLKAGMTVRVSDVDVSGNEIRFTAWSENTIRGAAGGTVLLAELAVAEGLLDE